MLWLFLRGNILVEQILVHHVGCCHVNHFLTDRFFRLIKFTSLISVFFTTVKCLPSINKAYYYLMKSITFLKYVLKFKIIFVFYHCFWLIFDQFWRFPKGSRKIKISKMAAVQEHDPILTSYDVTSSCYGAQRKEFWTSLCRLSFVVIALIF